MVCRKGDVGKEMYIVNQGVLEVVSEEGVVFAQMKEGHTFGEIRYTKQSNNNNNILSLLVFSFYFRTKSNFRL